MALSPTNNAAFLQEVDEAVRKDQLSSIMQRYGRWIVGAAIAALLAFGGYLYWEHRQTVARGEKAEQLLAAFDKAAAQPTAATADLKTLAGEGNAAYRAAALIEQSNMKAKAGDLKGAAALLAQVAGDAKLDQSMRDMALVRQTALEFDTMKPEAVIVNTSRGEVIDEHALTRMLQAEEIAGAGLDVVDYSDGISADLRALRNVVLLPHMGSATREGRAEMGEKVIINIKTFADGHRPPDQVFAGLL